MRTLNRPMFNMGGPLKEGIMHGIREPYKGGGRTLAGGNQIGMPMGNRTGFADPRKNIAARTAGWVGSKIPGFTKGWAKRAWDKYKFPPKMQATTPTGPGITTATKAVPFMQRAGQYFKQHPYLSTLGPAYAGFTDPGQAVLKMAAQTPVEVAQFATEALTPKRYEKYLPPNEWWAWGGPKWTPGDIRGETPPPDKTLLEKITMEQGVPGGGDKRMTYTDPDKANKLAKADKDKRVNNLLEIMGYDKSKKDAAYDALIDASQIISQAPGGESLDISRDIIQPAIGAASKRFDKPKEIREAVGLLMAKGEVEKDIAQAKGTSSEQAIDALATASGRTKKYVANAKLGIPNTVAEAKSQLVKLKKGPVTSDDVTTVAMSFAEENGIPFKQQFTTEQKNEVVGKGKKYPSVLEMINAMKLDPNGADDGLYVVGTSIVEVEKGTPKLKG